MEQASVGRGQKHSVRLKPNHGHDKCQQTLVGSNASDFLDGSISNCNERIYGYDGDDVLVGGPGNNKMDGGNGADVITGGRGADTFVYERAGDSPIDAPDIITDFKSRDTLDFNGLARTANVALSFIGWHAFTGIPGQVNYELSEYWRCDQDWRCGDQFLTIVQVDLTGSGTPDFCVDLYGTHVLKPKNFMLGSGQQQPEA
jgi:serralysin